MREYRQKTTSTASQRNTVRIIGGRWRGRRIAFPSASGLRPTGDRLRETLFNWLAPVIQDAVCLDAFAGSGVLGLEALSRGAAKVIFVDNARVVIQQLHATFDALGCANGEVVQADSTQWLAKPAPQTCDVVFLDPPFAAQYLPAVINALHANHWVASGGWIYIERAFTAQPLLLPANWRLHRDKITGDVHCSLYQCD